MYKNISKFIIEKYKLLLAFLLISISSNRDAQGCTPFMSAVSGRAYPAAISLIDTFLRLAQESARDPESRKKFMEPMIYPKGALPDDSPLHVLCYNDTCSFTWTGAEHINQVFKKKLSL